MRNNSTISERSQNKSNPYKMWLLTPPVILLTVISDIIIWNGVFPELDLTWKWMVCLPTAIILCLMVAVISGHGGNRSLQLFIGSLLFLAVPKLVFSVFAWPFGWVCGLIVSAIVIILFTYATTYGWLRLTVKKKDLVFPDLPDAFDGYRILQISDFHIGTFANHPEFIEKMVTTANSLNADLIVFTGDLINTSVSEIKPFTQMLSQLKAKDGKLSIMGNHDYMDTQNVVKAEKEMGWNLLLDSHIEIHKGQHTIYIIGVEHTGKPPFESRGNLKQALAGVPNDAFKILLTHDPSHWRMEVLDTTNIQLSLSGHTHGGQLKIGWFSPAGLICREIAGIYTQQGRMLYVSMGVGGRIPFRLGAWPEINLLTLRNKLS